MRSMSRTSLERNPGEYVQPSGVPVGASKTPSQTTFSGPAESGRTARHTKRQPGGRCVRSVSAVDWPHRGTKLSLPCQQNTSLELVQEPPLTPTQCVLNALSWGFKLLLFPNSSSSALKRCKSHDAKPGRGPRRVAGQSLCQAPQGHAAG